MLKDVKKNISELSRNVAEVIKEAFEESKSFNAQEHDKKEQKQNTNVSMEKTPSISKPVISPEYINSILYTLSRLIIKALIDLPSHYNYKVPTHSVGLPIDYNIQKNVFSIRLYKIDEEQKLTIPAFQHLRDELNRRIKHVNFYAQSQMDLAYRQYCIDFNMLLREFQLQLISEYHYYQKLFEIESTYNAACEEYIPLQTVVIFYGYTDFVGYTDFYFYVNNVLG